MAMRAALILSVVLFSVSNARAQDDPAAGQEKIVLIEPPKSIEEALERRKTAETAAAVTLAEAEAAYAAEVDKADKQLVGELKQLAKQSVATGDLPAAAKAWDAVLAIDSRDADALGFFATIGRKKSAVELSKTAVSVSPRKLLPSDVAGKKAEFFWQKSNWHFLPNGTILNEDTNRVMENVSHWRVEGGTLSIYDSKGHRVAIDFTAILVNGELHLLGAPAQYLHVKNSQQQAR